MCAYVGVLTPLSDVKVQQTLPVLVLRVTTALAVPPGAPAGVSAAPVIFTPYVRLRAFLTFAPAELVVVLALVLLLELLLLPQPATPIRATARLGMRSFERIKPSRLWTDTQRLDASHGGCLNRRFGHVAPQLASRYPGGLISPHPHPINYVRTPAPS